MQIFKRLLLVSGLLVSVAAFAQDPVPQFSYTFEHGLPADDAQVYPGVLNGNAAIVPMTDGNHALFTGWGYLDLTTAFGKTAIGSLSGNYTISIDLCFGTTNSLASYCWGYAFANGTSQYIGLVNTAGNANWYYEIKNGSTTSTKAGAGLTTGKWHTVTVVQSGTTNTIYVDGVSKASTANSLSASSLASALTGCYLGKSPFSGDEILLNAFVDNFKIYNSALSSTQVSNLYNLVKNQSATTTANIASNLVRAWVSKGNPVVTHKYTADPAAMVYKDTLFIFTGQDAAGGQTGYNMKNWCCFATTDMKHYVEYATPLKATDFSWASSNAAWAGQVVERNGKFYWYISTNTTGIGVAVADRPEGPYKDALGRALLTNANSPGMTHSWRTIDPSVFVDDDGQAWLFWGNGATWCCKLNADMTSINAAYGTRMVSIQGTMDFPFTEAPWVHKKNGKYYLSFAVGFPERIAYAVSDKIDGPFQYVGIINEIAGNSNTNHQAILEFKNNWYFIYHNGGIQTDGGSFSRSLCIDKLEFDENGLYKPVVMTTKGVDAIPVPVQITPPLASTSDGSDFIRLDKPNAQVLIKENVPYRLLDAQGRVVKKGKGNRVDLSALHPGVYIVSTRSNRLKFVI